MKRGIKELERRRIEGEESRMKEGEKTRIEGEKSGLKGGM